MHTKTQAEFCLKRLLNNQDASFKEGQWEAIDAVINQRKKVLVVQKTGWGKSAVYFVATQLNRMDNRGITLVISPLLSLMRNQMYVAENSGLRCATINSSNKKDWDKVKSQIFSNSIDILLISPERLSNDDFVQNVLLKIASNIGLFVVDEVHCISDWGHDFRPDYRRISAILRYLPSNTPIIGTTATANNRVIQDIKEQFGSGIVIQRGSLTRGSLSLDTLSLPDKSSRLVWLSKTINKLKGSGIVYVLTQDDAETVSEWLNKNGITSEPYYSNVEELHPQISREYLENALLSNNLKVLVATSALGMGFDKPDINFVIHYQVPGNVISYYQQVGRAGRGISNAYGILLAGKEDAAIQQYFRTNAFPTEQEIMEILTILDNSDGLSLNELEAASNLRRSQIEKTLKYLYTANPPPLTKRDSKWYRLPVDFSMDKEEINFLTHQRELEWAQMNDYINTNKCKMQFLAYALDNNIAPCGKCSSCRNAHLFSTTITESERKDAAVYLNRRYKSFTPKTKLPKGIIHDYPCLIGLSKLPDQLKHEIGYILCRWGENDLGEEVSNEKHKGYFTDTLVDAFVQMIESKGIVNNITWVTCVPSVRHPGLVPNFAQRVAAKLNVPFYDVVEKVKENHQQKVQQNTAHRCKNLDGVFSVSYVPMSTPVLLVDDIYDSGWTMAIISALLKSTGISAVYPATLSYATSN